MSSSVQKRNRRPAQEAAAVPAHSYVAFIHKDKVITSVVQF